MASMHTNRTPHRWTMALATALVAAQALTTFGLGAHAASGATTWTGATAPLGGVSPSANTDPTVDFGKGVAAHSSAPVACPTTTSCVAVGNYADTSGNTQGLIETMSGGTWTASTAPLNGLNPAPTTNPLIVLTSLSCPATGTCIAVGTYNDTNGQAGLIETMSNGSWTASTAPLSGLSTYTIPRFALNQVTCYLNGPCVAVGRYQDSSNTYQGLIETLSGSTWTPTAAPTTNLNPVPNSAAPNVSINGVSCPSTTWCVASGSYDAASGVQGLIETL